MHLDLSRLSLNAENASKILSVCAQISGLTSLTLTGNANWFKDRELTEEEKKAAEEKKAEEEK